MKVANGLGGGGEHLTIRYAPLDRLEPLRAASAQAGLKAEVELHPAVEQGFAFPGGPAYDKMATNGLLLRLLFCVT